MNSLFERRHYFEHFFTYQVSRFVSFGVTSFNKKFPNPYEELFLEVTTGIQKIFPLAKAIAHKIVFETPPSHIEADYAFTTFLIAELTGQNPAEVATQIVEYFLKNPLAVINKIYTVGPYVNIEVDKWLFREKALNNILNQGDKFETYVRKKPSTILINYTSSNSSPEVTLDDLRALLVGKVIGECYKRSGKIIKQKYYFADWNNNEVRSFYTDQFQKSGSKKYNDLNFFRKKQKKILQKIRTSHRNLGIKITSYAAESTFFLLGQKVISDAIHKGLAMYIPNTQAIIATATDNTESLVLQKNDGLGTSLVRYLAFIKANIVKTHPSNYIYISSVKEKPDAINSLFNYAQQLGYLSEIKISVLSTSQNVKPDFLSHVDRSFQYTLLRTPLNKEIKSDSKDSEHYSHIVNFIHELKNWTGKENLINDFSIIELLISFPLIVNEIQISHNPSQLCLYIEKVIQECEKVSAYQDRQLSKATVIVLENALKLLALEAT